MDGFNFRLYSLCMISLLLLALCSQLFGIFIQAARRQSGAENDSYLRTAQGRYEIYSLPPLSVRQRLEYGSQLCACDNTI
ncbi:hypothetical protein B0H16DRAFT_1513685 [Mycena metata]|uniref:Uncharacterized protein n=1 Tax=Mycena metata TaxID=1033252 RepID=A0AAD7JTJ7_9AGAR|nr:hypothetical protein B0H16DRAFT_1513685 [Mycena metata]